MPIQIDFNTAPEGLVTNLDGHAKIISADLDQWRTIVAAMRAGTMVNDGRRPDYFPSSNSNDPPNLRGENISIRTTSPTQLSGWIQSKLPMKLISWNVGTTYKNQRQSYLWTTFKKIIRFSGENAADVYCLQELPKLSPKDTLCNSTNIAQIYRKYHILRAPGDEYSLLCMVRKEFVKEATLTAVALSLRNHHPFAQRISFTTEADQSVVIFNVHLLAEKEKNPKGEIETRSKDRVDQINALKIFCKDGDILCGDFNIAQDAGGANKPIISTAFPELKFVWPPTPPSPLSYVQNGARKGERIVSKHQYDYIARYNDEYNRISFSMNDPGHSGGYGQHRHLPVTADVTI